MAQVHKSAEQRRRDLVEAACAFARSEPGRVTAIGALEDLPEILAGTRVTRISTEYGEPVFHELVSASLPLA